MRTKKRALFNSLISLLLCVSMLVGTTFAWFTDSVSSENNIIAAGSLDIKLDYLAADGTWKSVGGSTEVLDKDAVWEPGYTEVAYLRVTNAGNLALKYALGIGILSETGSINAAGDAFKLSDFIKFGVVELSGESTYATRDDARNAVLNSSKLISEGYSSAERTMTAQGDVHYLALVVYMPEDVGNAANYATGATAPEIELGIELVATQTPYESDSFGTDYDSGAVLDSFSFPENLIGDNVSAGVTNDGNKVAAEVEIQGTTTSAKVPAGVQLEDGVNQLTLEVTPMSKSDANITLGENEEARSLDVHVAGVAADNTQPMEITIKEAAAKGLNAGNLKLYHVEKGSTVQMTAVDTFTAHNQFKYDPATGDITLYMATFSEVALVADTVNAWKGTVATAFAGGSGTESDPYLIANADQFVYFGDLISNDNDNDKYGEKYYKLINNINFGGETNANKGNIFYPIGYHAEGVKIATVAFDDAPEAIYEINEDAKAPGAAAIAEGDATKWYTYGGAFKGTFDGAGHTVANIYQNTWQLKGNYDGNYWNAAMGLFGYVYGGTVKNLTVDNFTSDGEFTPTGVIAAYAAGDATFENIAITKCNPRVYNTGNGGIIGIAGNTSAANDDHITLKNITVDNSNKISALWGSWDVACGGLVGMYRGNVDGSGNATGDTISFENCHVSAIIDVYNDVCANYQYYAYRYAGMIIGSVRHNTKNADGKTIPDMTGISAEDCTVNYGDWNDYYYCEFEKNTMASYSEDYQFSRVPHSELDFTDSNGNGVVDADERDSVTGCKHTHTAEENHQAIYLPFHQLFTGYSWGVSSIGLKEYSGIVTDLGITEGDQEESVEKFEGKVTELANNKVYKFSDIFNFVDNGVKLVPDALTVTVTNVDEKNPVSATIVYDEENWENGTLTLTGKGDITITIQDYYFCTPTTITVNVTERQPEEKFDVVMNNGDFLHRVGNSGAVAIDKLFKAKEGVTVGTVSVTVEAVNGTAASGAYTANADDWTKGTIQFSGTGVVKVTIQDYNFCTPTELTLEVVDATNITNATGTTTGGNFVLLCDVNTTTYVNYWNCTLYGNGFTYSLKGAPTSYNSKQGKGIIITKNAVLDNIVIVGDVYTGYGAFTENNYYNTAIDVTGDTKIQNCYISGCAAPVRARNNVEIKDTTLYGGTVGNLIIEDGTATLENVTTANYDDGRAMVGMGIVIHSDATESAKLVLNGTLTQYNFISESKVPSDTYAKNLHSAMFGSSCSQYHFGTSPNRYVNTGIISLTSTFNGEDITDNAKTGYVGKSLKVSSYDGYVYTQPNTSGSVNNNAPEYKPTSQGAVPPSYSFDFTNKNYLAKTDGSNDYCYEENGKVNISMDEGDTFNWDTSILTIGKGITNYTVSMNGTDYTGKSIAFNTAGDYTVTYTYTDDNNSKLDENGNITTYSVTYTKMVNITVAVVKATTKHAEFTFGSSNTASTTVTVGNNTYVMPDVSGTSSTIGSTTVNGQTIYYPIVEIIMSDGKTSHTSGWYAYFPVFSGAVTITDYANNGTGDKMTPYNGSTTTMPSGLSVVGDAKALFKYQSGSNAGETPVVKNNILVYSSAKIEAKRSEYNTVIQYSYTDNAGATYCYYIGYHAPAQSYSNTCVTPDTLITLADGTKVRVDSLSGSEMLMVWNHSTGAFDTAPVAYIVDHEGKKSMTEVITLGFSDDSSIDIIGEHVFFDADLNKYVAITGENAEEFIGHKFISANDEYSALKAVELVSVDREIRETEIYEVVSYQHLTCFTNDILSCSAYLDPLLNIFDIVPETMTYDAAKAQKDIETYGLYTYRDFEELISEEAFELYNAAHLKVAVGKGYIDWDGILKLIDIYFAVDVTPITK